jgi:uncharacterized membrane protein YphA (DoxX/SURF4 family)
MNEPYRKILEWQWRHNTLASDLVRIFLGVSLFARGVLFLVDPSRLDMLIDGPGLGWFGYYVTWAHLIGGLLMTFGFLTRLSALIQLPILFGAVTLVHLREGLFAPTQSLELSTLVLFLLCVVLVFGSGRFSLDYYLYRRRSGFGATPAMG